MPQASDVVTGEKKDPLGSAQLTKKLRIQFSRENIDAQTSGESPPAWEDWLQARGFGLNKGGMVFKAE